MRTTLTLDPDVARLLDEEVHRQRKPFKQVVNEAIRRGLSPVPSASQRGRFRVRPHRTTLRPGIDPGSLNRLVDELEDEAVVEKLRSGR
ncbi:MAG TPA: antitoxin [Thermoanaerobaculia bacterium]|nr:antitoxin [Thermoanaerobaculia bacterium]